MVAVLGHHVVLVFAFGQIELAFAVSHPDAELVATQRTEHHAVVLRDVETQIGTLKLVGVVVEHLLIALTAVAAHKTQFYHQLTTVADAQ